MYKEKVKGRCRGCKGPNLFFYDGCLGYEAIVCVDCNYHHSNQRPILEIKKCPNCLKEYTPELERKKPEIPIQEEFPHAPKWQREQHISGLCSDECWDEFLGVKNVN